MRWILIATILTGVARLPANAEGTPVRKFHVSLSGPAYTHLPLWIQADLSFPLEVHYPYGEDPGNFGPNRLEVTRDGEVLKGVSSQSPWTTPSAGAGLLDGTVAPANSPRNRLPLHLQYPLDKPGHYSLRWTKVQRAHAAGRPTETVVAQSDWFTFEVRESTPGQREAWLRRRLVSVPTDPGLLVGDYLPSLLAAAPDVRVLRVILEQLYSHQPVVPSVALASLRFFKEEGIRDQAMDLLRRRGPSERMAQLVSWHQPLFHNHGEELVRLAVGHLRPPTGAQTGAALRMLGPMLHAPAAHWSVDPKLAAWAEREVFAVARAIIAKGSSEALQPLAEYLGGVKNDRARELLWEIIRRPETEHEQALTALTWIGDPRDLPRLGELLLTPGGSDRFGRDRAGLPYSLIRTYGTRAIPILEKALADSPYPFVRTQSAKELALQGRPAAFRFFLDAVENDRFYRAELVNWLKDYFPNQLPRAADDAAVIAFLNSRLQQ